MRADNKNKKKTIKQESGGSASKREQSPRQTKETGFWMNEQWNQDKMQILSQPVMGNWLQSEFIESHIRVGNYDNMAFVFYDRRDTLLYHLL